MPCIGPRLVVTACILVVICGMADPVTAGDFRAKDGFYIGVSIPRNSVNGDFKGEDVLTSSSDIILIPKVKDGTGFGIALGGRFDRVGLEVSYLRSKHDITFLGAKGDAELSLLNLDGKLFVLTDRPVQPYFLLGLTLPRFVVKDGSASLTSVGDGEFTGIGLNGGGGLAFYFHPRFALHVGATYRAVLYTSAQGVETSGTIGGDEILDGSGLCIDAGVAFTF